MAIQQWSLGHPGFFDGWQLDAEGNRLYFDPQTTDIGGQPYVPLSAPPQDYLSKQPYANALDKMPDAFKQGPDGQWYMSTEAQGATSSVMGRNRTLDNILTMSPMILGSIMTGGALGGAFGGVGASGAAIPAGQTGILSQLGLTGGAAGTGAASTVGSGSGYFNAGTGLMDFSAPTAGSIGATTPGLSLGSMGTSSGFSLAPGAGLTLEGASALADAPWGVNPRNFGDFMNDYNPLDPGTNPLEQFNFQGTETGIGNTNPLLNPELGTTIPNAVNGLTAGSGLWGTAASTAQSLLGKLTSTIGETAAKSALGRLLNGSATADDYAKILGSAGAAGLGVLGANTQANAYKDVADKYMAMGAPYRDKLNASYAPGFDLAKQDPAFQGALDQSSQSILRGLSTQGNPFDNPGGLVEANKQITNGVTLPQLNTYRSQLGSFGQLGTNTAGTADMGKAQNAGNGLNALGYGVGQITSNDGDLGQLLKKYGGILGGNGLSLNSGSTF